MNTYNSRIVCIILVVVVSLLAGCSSGIDHHDTLAIVWGYNFFVTFFGLVILGPILTMTGFMIGFGLDWTRWRVFSRKSSEPIPILSILFAIVALASAGYIAIKGGRHEVVFGPKSFTDQHSM